MKRLIEIQQKLKAPKNQYNWFWKYKYRSCEDILQAVKPLLAEQKLVLILEDEVVCEWDREYSRANNKQWQESESVFAKWCRFYIKATAKLIDENWKILAQSSALAREEEEKKWMDGSQITWTASSYARKYALNWLFAIDDWIDSDSTNKWEKSSSESQSKSKKWFNDADLKRLEKKTEYLKKFETSDDLIKDIQKFYSISDDMKIKVADIRANIDDTESKEATTETKK